MTLDDKRKVIEVLLCCGYPNDGTVTTDTAHRYMHCVPEISRLADREWEKIDPYLHPGLSLEACSADYIEAAYRLIESSPTLVREWFKKGTTP